MNLTGPNIEMMLIFSFGLGLIIGLSVYVVFTALTGDPTNISCGVCICP